MNEIKSGTKFCHFTSLDNARNIINGGCFFLSKYDGMNDGLEESQHKDEKDRVFCLSFSNSEALNIPAYYLYGGIDGKGCRLGFTDAKIRALIRNCSVNFVNTNNQRLKKTVESNSYSVHYDWIHYIAEGGYCEYRQNTDERYNSIDDAIDALRKDNKHYFVKNPVWKYENEFRIVVVFDQPVTKYCKIALSFDVKEKERGISIAFGPETTKEEFDLLSDEFHEYGIVNCDWSSKYKISMRLVERNRSILR